MNEFLARHPGLYVVAESGDMLFGGMELRLRGGQYMAQGYYASMGFGVPAALGAQIGTGQRPLILCGDGAFQMTGCEISHAPRHGLNPICIVVNNSGWGIFRPVVERQDLLDVPPWPYAELGRALRRRRLPRHHPRRAAAARSPPPSRRRASRSSRRSLRRTTCPRSRADTSRPGRAASRTHPTRRRPSIVSSQPTPRSRSSAV